ncbi:MAG: SDR family oxidoreductase [Bacteroidetes bacterium]|nr:SDR family oxidoreductase [Bacteroidota bacterium]
MNLFITGTTGFLGGELLINFSKRKEIEKIFCLVRAESKEEADERLKKVFELHEDFYDPDKIIAVTGNLAQNDLAEQLCNNKSLQDVNAIVHAAADTNFSPIYDDIVEQINIHGLEKILKWGKALKNLETFLYIGTATICGMDIKNRIVKEDESPNEHVKHLVKYTETKMRGEIMIRQYLPKEKILIARPSIIMGDTRPWVPRSYVIMWALAAINLLRLVPINPNSQLDIIPVDYASNAIVNLLFSKRKYSVYHISSGEKSATTPFKATKAIEHYFPHRPEFSFVGRELIREVRLWARKQLNGHNTLKNYREHLNYWNDIFDDATDLRILMGGLEPYLDFIELGQVFDNSRLLEDVKIGLPEPAHEYMKRSAQYLDNIDIFSDALAP